MTPQERLAQLRTLADAGNWDLVHEVDAIKLLAIAEAVPDRLKRGHDDACHFNLLTAMRCTCGHDKLAAAWATLRDE